MLISESLCTELIQYTHNSTITEHSKRNVTDALLLRQFLSQVCNEIDAQLIIFKYKKNTIKRKEKLHTEARR